jgi:glycosyltransferase involved in cell wall biosynthesis
MITLALTHFNRFTLIREAIAQVKDDNRISEIVISDDASTDGSYEKLQEVFKLCLKVKLYQNTKRLDCYANKHAAVSRATNKWVVLFDSDNVMPPAYLDTLFRINRKGTGWQKNEAYLPVQAQPHFDYTAFSGCVIDRTNVRRYLDRKHFMTALNTANYFFHRDEYLRVWDGSVDPHTADSIYQNYRWLEGGNTLVFVSNLVYFHRVHADSHYKQNVHKTGNFAKHVELELRKLS